MTLLECILWGLATACGLCGTALHLAFGPRWGRSESYDFSSRHQASEITASVDKLLELNEPLALRSALAVLEDFRRTMEAYYHGRAFSQGDVVLHTALIDGIYRLKAHVAVPVVTP